MTKLWILLSVCLVIARIIESRDRRMNRYGTHRREHLFTFLLVIILGFFCGLRIWGNDTGTYLEIYHHLTPTLDQLSPESLWDFSSGIALTYFFSLFKTLGFSSQDMLMTFAFATSIMYGLSETIRFPLSSASSSCSPPAFTLSRLRQSSSVWQQASACLR